MASRSKIDSLLKSVASPNDADKLVAWADEVRMRIVRGDMQIGILASEEVAKIATAYRRAAELGKNDSWIKLGLWLAAPEFGESDLAGAEAALQKAIALQVFGSELELVRLRWVYMRETVRRDKMAETFRLAASSVDAEPENSEALYFLALLTTHGFGTAASPEHGFQLQNQAANLGSTNAMFELYIHYANGLGVPKDDARAFEACLRAANGGHSRAMCNLGAFHAAGRGTSKNIEKAIKWYDRAAAAGNPRAMAGLAAIYAMGDGVEKDVERAERLLEEAEYCGLDVSALRKKVGM